MSFMSEFKIKLRENEAQVIDWRRHLHRYPELSFEEVKTARFIADHLRSFGLDVQTEVGGRGVTALIKGKYPGKTIAFRADFDALPISDEKQVAYKSTVENVMHACGHDGHTASLLAFAQVLIDFVDVLHGNVLLIFQHAEEKPPGGAKEMVATGLLHQVDYVYAAHLASDLPLGKVAFATGFKMAAVDKFSIQLQGRGGHGARPHKAVDALVIGANVVGSLQNIVSRHVNPLEAAVVTVGIFKAGSAFNIIADRAEIEGTVRTFNEPIRKTTEKQIHSIVHGITEAFGGTVEIDYLRGYPALYNDEAATGEAIEVAQGEFGEDAVIHYETSMGAEDFAYFLQERPGTYFRVGSQIDEATGYSHHHPKFDFAEAAMFEIARMFAALTEHHLVK